MRREDSSCLLNGRRGCLGPIDTKLAKQEARRLERAALYKTRQRSEANRRRTESKSAELSNSSNEEAFQAGSSDEDASANTPLPLKRMKPTAVVNSNNSAAN